MAHEGSAATRDRTAPATEHAAKADSPADLPRRALLDTAKSAFAQFQRHQATDLAAALTYYSVLAIFPGLLALVSLLGVFGRGESTVQTLLDLVRGLGQADVAEQLRGPVEAMVNGRGAGLALVIGIVTALSSASGYVGAFGRALNRVYEIDEGRSVWRLRPLTFLVTLGLTVLAGVVLVGLVVSGQIADQVGSLIGLGPQAVFVWGVVKWPVMLLVVMGMVAVLYYVTPNVRQPRFRWMSPGAVVAILAWVLASVLFGLYVGSFGKYDATYGSLGGVIVFLLWLWITNLALLFGAEVDAELERTRELVSGIPAERTIQLPPRDATGSERAAEKLEQRVHEGRLLRHEAMAGRAGQPVERATRRPGAPGRHRSRPEAAALELARDRLEPLPSEVARMQAEHDL